MEAVLAPPYDVVNRDQVPHYLERSPYNVLRLDLGVREDGALHSGDWAHAARLFRDWLASGVLVPDPEPSVYVLRHHYQAPDGTQGVLTGAFAGLRAGPAPIRAALPHERTIPAVWAGRLEQLKHCRAHFSPILAVVQDQAGSVREALGRVCRESPSGEAESPFGGRLELWVCPASTQAGRGLLHALAASLAEQPAVIADGHHRFEAACRFSELEAGGVAADPRAAASPQASRYVLAALTPAEGGGLAILPIHRVVGPAGPAVRERLHLSLYEYLGRLSEGEWPADLRASQARGLSSPAEVAHWVRRLRSALGRTVMAVYWGPGQVEFLAEPAKAAWRGGAARPELPGAASDVLLLQRGPLSGYELQPDLSVACARHGAQGTRPWVSFTPVAEEAVAAVDGGRAAAAMLLSPVTLQEVREVALAAKKMPEKSTYFYPKLTSGLVLADLELEVLPWGALEALPSQ